MTRPTIALFLCLGLVTACGRPFDAKTPSGFVELDERFSDYDYRATTADGLVIGVRVEKHKPRGELAFWERAIENHLRMRGGYALLDKRDVKNADGISGRQLRFGHDEAGKPHLYYVTLYPTKRKLFILEAGGSREEVETNAALIEEAISQFHVKRCWRQGC
jgi:hypothetical protein